MTRAYQPGLCSVVCTTYNHASYVTQSIQSIFDQEYRHIEIVIIDDGSTDDNVVVIRKLLEGSPFPNTLISQENTGKIGLNVNRALDAAQGEFVTFLSLDDLLLPDCISSKMEVFAADTNMSVVANTSNSEISPDGQVITEEFRTPLFGKDYSTAGEMLEHEFEHFETFFMQGTLIRRSVLDAVGGYDVDLIGDDLIIRTKIWQYMVQNPQLTFRMLPQPGFAYRKHDANIHRDVFRQLRTVLEWRDRFFPGRALPKLFEDWAMHFINECVMNGRFSDLSQAREYSPEIRDLHNAIRSTWKYRRRAAKGLLRRYLGTARG